MGLLNFLSRKEPPPSRSDGILRLPSGSFTVDRSGRIITSTLPRSFPTEVTEEIGNLVLSVLESSRQTQTPLSELMIDFAALKLTARELRGGAIIFLAPHGFGQK